MPLSQEALPAAQAFDGKLRRVVRHPEVHESLVWLPIVRSLRNDLTDPRIRRAVFRSVSQLTAASEDYLAQHNQQPNPFIGTAKASDILEKVKRRRAALRKL